MSVKDLLRFFNLLSYLYLVCCSFQLWPLEDRKQQCGKPVQVSFSKKY